MRQTPSPGTLTLPGMEDVGLSPIRRQFLELKRRQPDALLLFRLGDFYETFEDDAHLAARVLDITLTSREMGRGERVAMAGIPAHAADAYIARLIAQGIAVAIADQMGTVSRNGLVPREITRVLTPGMLLESDLLTGSRSNFLLSLLKDGAGFGLAYVDVSTGELLVTSVTGPNADEFVAAELVRIGPAEVLRDADTSVDDLLPPGAATTRRGPELFAPLAATRAVVRCFGGAPEASGLTDHPLALRALGALLAYVGEARPGATRTLQHPRLYADRRLDGARSRQSSTTSICSSPRAAKAARRSCGCSTAPARRWAPACCGRSSASRCSTRAHQRAPRRGRAPGRRHTAALATGRGAARPA